MKIVLKSNVPDTALRFAVPHPGRKIKLKQGDELEVLQDLTDSANEVLVKTSNDQRDNAWISTAYVYFPEL